jgi:DNA-binding CsgD family transcriptional regulator
MQLNDQEDGAFLTQAAVEEAALDAVLEHIPSAVFFCDEDGLVVRCNRLASRLLQAAPETWEAELSRIIASETSGPEYAVSRLAVPGHAPHFLIVVRSQGDRVGDAIKRAKHAWKLTTRETQVLACVASGQSNRAIADDLGLATRTIELHVTSLLSKAGAESRAQLIIALWELSDARPTR